jgi:hypothetical protein
VSSMIRSFGATRMAVGALAWVAPATAGRVFGLDPNSDPVVAQLFGVRDFGLGALTAGSSGDDLIKVLRVGVAIDAIDAIGCLRRRKQLSMQGKILTAGGAVLFAVIGAGSLATMARTGS